MPRLVPAMCPKYVGIILQLLYTSVCIVHMAYMEAWLEDKIITTKKGKKQTCMGLYYNGKMPHGDKSAREYVLHIGGRILFTRAK